MSEVKILTRLVSDYKVNYDREVAKLVVVDNAEEAPEGSVEVLSIYKDTKGEVTHYRLSGYKNTCFRKAEDCGNVTFNPRQSIYAVLQDIHYDIPEEGLPDKEFDVESIKEADVGGVVTIVAAGLITAQGDVTELFGNSEVGDTRIVEYIAARERTTFANECYWIKLKGDPFYYVIDAQGEAKVALIRKMHLALKHRNSMFVTITDKRTIVPLTLAGDEVIWNEPTVLKVVIGAKPIKLVGNHVYRGIQEHVGESHNVAIITGITRKLGYDANKLLLNVTNAFTGEEGTILIDVNLAEGGWNFNSDIQDIANRAWMQYIVTYTTEAKQQAALETDLLAASDTDVLWRSKNHGAPSKFMYVTCLAMLEQQQQQYTTHINNLQSSVPGLKWHMVDEVYSNGDVYIAGFGKFSGTREAAQQLQRMIAASPADIIIVGVVGK